MRKANCRARLACLFCVLSPVSASLCAQATTEADKWAGRGFVVVRDLKGLDSSFVHVAGGAHFQLQKLGNQDLFFEISTGPWITDWRSVGFQCFWNKKGYAAPDTPVAQLVQYHHCVGKRNLHLHTAEVAEEDEVEDVGHFVYLVPVDPAKVDNLLCKDAKTKKKKCIIIYTRHSSGGLHAGVAHGVEP